jgi:hypothetical protein
MVPQLLFRSSIWNINLVAKDEKWNIDQGIIREESIKLLF